MTGILTPADLLGIANQTDTTRGAATVGYDGSTVGAFLNEIANGTATAITSPTGTEVVPVGTPSGLQAVTTQAIAQIAVNIGNTEVPVPITSATTVLTFAQYNAGIINFSGALTNNSTVQLPSTSGVWVFANNTTGAFSLTLLTAAGGATAAVPQGQSVIAYSDGTNVIIVSAAGGGGGTGPTQTVTQYDFVANAGQTVFNVPYVPGDLIVTHSGLTVPANQYIASNGTSVTLLTPAGAGDAVSIVTFEPFSAAGALTNYEFIATAGQTTFNAVYTPGAVQVYQNGIILFSPDFQATTGTSVILNTGANAGDQIKVVSQQTSSVVGIVPASGGAFVGPVTGITAAPGDDSTTFATTAFVTAAVAAGGGGGGGSGVSSFNTRTGAVTLTSSDVDTALGFTPAPLASPVFTGAPQAPTQSPGNNTTSLATTAFVTAAVAAAGTAGVSSFNTRTGAVTLTSSDVDTALGFTPANSTALAGLAPLASPTFTGSPAAPTATAGTSTTQIATTAFVGTAITGLAPLASPVFTGAPQAPTQSPGNNTTSLATTAFVTSALGSYATTASLAAYATLNNPAFTGAPTAPTATAGTNTTQLATTAFVAAAVAAGSSGVSSFNTRTGAVTLTTADVTGAGGAPLANPAFTGIPTAPTATAGTTSTQLATTAFVATSFAPLVSPGFTGSPTTPTQTGGSNNTLIASTAYVYNAVQGSQTVALTNAAVTLTAAQYSVPVIVFTGAITANIVVTVPITGEWRFLNLTSGAFTVTISSGTGATVAVPQSTTSYMSLVSNATEGVLQASASSSGVASFNTRTGAVTLTTADVTGAGGAPLASPVFTGVPAAPTATVGTDTTQVATTAFVYGATQGESSVAVTNANVTLTAAQYSVPVVLVSGTLTANVILTFPTAGAWNVVNSTTGAFTVTLSNGTGTTVVAQQGAACDVVSATTGMVPVQSNTVIGRLQSDAQSATVSLLGSVSGTVTLNLGTASEWTLTVTGNTTFAFTNTLGTNQTEVFFIRMTNGGSATIFWPTGTQFGGGTPPAYTTSGTDLLGVKYDSTTSTYFVFVIGLAIAT
jgi:hypothetical protein